MSKKNRKHKRAGNWTLRACYDFFNKTHFENRLPEPGRLDFVKNLEDDGITTWHTSGAVCISIHDDFRKHLDVGAIVLLHEMAHVAMGPGYEKGTHGLRYHAELHRLFMAGAYDKLL